MSAFDLASSSLAEARSLCLVDSMAIGLADCDHEAAVIAIESGNPWQGRIMLDSLSGLAARHGYTRLRREVENELLALAAIGQEPGPGDRVDLDADGQG